MTIEEAIKILKGAIKKPNTKDGYLGQALDMAIKALEQESITWIVGKDNCQVAVRNMPIDKMQKICAIIGDEEQQPKTGYWINGNPICPCCGEDKYKDLDADIWADWQPKYCPNCGSYNGGIEKCQ